MYTFFCTAEGVHSQEVECEKITYRMADAKIDEYSTLPIIGLFLVSNHCSCMYTYHTSSKYKSFSNNIAFT